MGPLAFTAGIIGWSAMGVVLVTIGSGRNSVGGTIFGIETRCATGAMPRSALDSSFGPIAWLI